MVRSGVSPQVTPGQRRTPVRTRQVAAIIESSVMRSTTPTSPPSTAPLAKRVMTPVEPSTSEVRERCRQYEEQLRKTLSVPTVSQLDTAPDRARKSQLELGLNTPPGTEAAFREKNLLKLRTKLLGSKESSCSSVLSSLESVESNTSEGNLEVDCSQTLTLSLSACESATESLLSSSCSSSLDLRPPGKTKISKIINKLQILSPISDKSQVGGPVPRSG